MALYNQHFDQHPDRLSQTDNKPHAWRRDEGDKLAGGDNTRPVREGQPMGGQSFGKNSDTSAANDKNNPSQYAGSSNPFFKPVEPMEEHPENSNFKMPDQQGAPDYDKAQPYGRKISSGPKPEQAERGNGENDRPHKGGDEYKENANGNDQPNIPGPNELPDQQKVGEDVNGDEREHIET